MEVLESRTLFAIAPAGPEFQVNGYEPGNQIYPAVASDSDGNFVVAWESQDQDSPGGYGIYAQRYDAAGAPLAGPIQVNTTTFGQQFGASVGMDDAGNFVVAWASQDQDGSGYGIFAQRFDSGGNRLGGEFQVNTYTDNTQWAPSVAVDSDGDFVVAWQSYGNDGDLWGVAARRYNAAGAAQGGEVQVNTTTAGIQAFPSVAVQDDGDFVVAFHSSPSPTGDVGTFDVRARDFVGGAFTGNDFQVNTFAAGDQAYPDADAAPNGGYVITWRSDGQDGDGAGVIARAFPDPLSAQPAAPEFQVNTTTAGDQSFPAVSVNDANGDMVVTWYSDEQDAPGGSGIYARQFNSSGTPLSGETQINQYTAGAQEFPDIADDGNGHYVITWASEDQDEAGGFAVIARRVNSFVEDTTAPTVDIVDVTPDPRTTPVDSITIVFSEPVTGFDLSDLQLFRDAQGNVLTGAQTLTTTDNQTFVLGNLAPVTDEAGDYVLFLNAAAAGITDAAGNALTANAQDAFRVNAVVTDRSIFYNNSRFDGNSAAANAADDGAIATDKEPLLPGQQATFANYTSYTLGVNGVMIDVRNLPDTGLTAADFRFRVGDNNNPNTWADGPEPTSITVREGAGAGGSDRITITFADGAVQNEWLEVTLLPTVRTGLAEADVSYVGNIPGETGDQPNAAVVNALDVAGVKGHLSGTTTTEPITNRYDFNRDGRVNALDVAAVKRNLLARITLIQPPDRPTGPLAATSLLFSDAPVL
jgi:hypothetical protein